MSENDTQLYSRTILELEKELNFVTGFQLEHVIS